MATLKALKTRIGSVRSSEKITGAMKMISSAKVHKFEAQLRRLLPFKDQLQSIMGHILQAEENFDSPLIWEREVNKVGIVVFGSDDGLCGAYNLNIFKELLVRIAKLRDKYGNNVKFAVYPVGKKMVRAVRRLVDPDIEIIEIDNINSKMEGEMVNDFTHSLREAFVGQELDYIEVVYMKFHSISRQRLEHYTLFPISKDILVAAAGDESKVDNKMYIFEPDPNRIFNEVLPMFVLSTMQEITIENRASEQAARIMAMQSANDNAKKLLESLQLEYNKARQAGITTELLDIIGGQVQR